MHRYDWVIGLLCELEDFATQNKLSLLMPAISRAIEMAGLVVTLRADPGGAAPALPLFPGLLNYGGLSAPRQHPVSRS